MNLQHHVQNKSMGQDENLLIQTLTWDKRPRVSSWMWNKYVSWSGSSHWTLGKEVLHTASPHHPSEAASGQENWSSLQTSPTSAGRCSPQWTLWCQGCWAWRPVLQAPTSLWPTESQRFLKATSSHVFSIALKNKTAVAHASMYGNFCGFESIFHE